MISKIQFLIDHDWNPLIQKYQYFKKTLINFPESKGKYIDGCNEYRYDFGAAGSIIYYNSITQNKKAAGAISGAIVENFLPWVSKLKADFSELNLVAIAFQENTENLLAHRDGQENHSTTQHCKLNYILDNYTDVTYVQDDNGTVNTYSSIKNTAWLIDTTKKHWTENNTEPRYLFQLVFHQDYHKIAQWFNRNGPLHYQ
jgi:hypothetical protein